VPGYSVVSVSYEIVPRLMSCAVLGFNNFISMLTCCQRDGGRGTVVSPFRPHATSLGPALRTLDIKPALVKAQATSSSTDNSSLDTCDFCLLHADTVRCKTTKAIRTHCAPSKVLLFPQHLTIAHITTLSAQYLL